MSIQLTPQDLSAAQIGATGSISLRVPGRPIAVLHNLPSIVFNNESGCGLSLNFRGSNRQTFLPAGGWTEPLDILNNDTDIDYKVEYVLPNAPVFTLYSILYFPGEKPLKITALGNSPIGISGNVQTSNVQSLQNDGKAPATQIIESTPSDQTTSSFSLDNDGSGFWQILSANVLRKVLNIVRGNNTSGKATISIGDSGDTSITTLYGTATNVPANGVNVGTYQDGLFGYSRAGTASNAVDLIDLQRTVDHPHEYTISIDALGNFGIYDKSGAKWADLVNNTIPAANIDNGTMGSGVIVGTASQVGDSGNTSFLQCTDQAASNYIQIKPGLGQGTRGMRLGYRDGSNVFHEIINIDTTGVTTVTNVLQNPGPDSFHVSSFFSGGGSGTFNHGLHGTPSYIGVMDSTTGSQTMGVSGFTSTTCVVDAGSGHAWKGIAEG